MNPLQSHSKRSVTKTKEIVSTQRKQRSLLLQIRTTPGNNRISSRSNKTNNTARNKKGVLIKTLIFNLSNPDSKGIKLRLEVLLFPFNLTWIKNNKLPTRNNKLPTTIKVIYLCELIKRLKRIISAIILL